MKKRTQTGNPGGIGSYRIILDLCIIHDLFMLGPHAVSMGNHALKNVQIKHDSFGHFSVSCHMISQVFLAQAI